jgi:hypothetical protein
MLRGVAVVFLLALGAIAAVAAAAGHSDSSSPHPVAAVTSGSFELGDSRSGTPIFEASDIGPGDGASGTVTIANDGDEAAELTLRQHDVVDTPGDSGGLLSRGMSMRIREISDPANPRPVYDGVLAPMPALDLGSLGSGQSRVFEFDASLPDGGTPTGATAGDNVFQGAALSVGYSWTATELPPPTAPAHQSTTPLTSPTGGSLDRAIQLMILRVRAAIWHRRLVLWAYCGPGTCRVLARLRFEAHRLGKPHGRGLGSLRRQRLVAGSQRLVFELPPGLRRALSAAASKGERATVSVVLVLRNREAGPLVARDAVRLRHLHPGVRHGRR